MPALSYNLFVEQGSDFEEEFEIRNEDGLYLNLDAFEVKAQARQSYASKIKYDLTLVKTPVFGRFLLRIPAAVTISMKYPRYVYDIEVVLPEGNKTLRIVEGNLFLSRGITA